MSEPSLPEQILDRARARGVMIATAESCTGGMIAARLTDIAGSSDAFDRGFVTYSNEAKMDMLGVQRSTLDAHGAVSAETALEMAAGALRRSRAALAVSVTGIAGPGGATPGKPVGLVWFAVATAEGALRAEKRLFPGPGRADVRSAAVDHALKLLADALS